MDEWFTQLQSKIFTRIQYALSLKAEAPYPNLNCTTGNANNEQSEFPALYFQTLGMPELGKDLENQNVNAVRLTGQIQTRSDYSEWESRDIAIYAVAELKRMRFNISMLPNTYTENNIHVTTFRFERVIGAQDDIG